MESLLQVLMERDGMSKEDAMNLINSAKEELYDRLAEGHDAYNICEEWFGLEPDFLMDLIDI